MKIFFADPQSENILIRNKISKIVNNLIKQKNYILGKQNSILKIIKEVLI